MLQAYTEEFSPADDVTLVIKDTGTDTFYRGGNARERIEQLAADQLQPEIVYLNHHYTSGQLASLYTACDCLAAPYHGEGFGMPILEALACGLPAIIPQGGPSDEFTSDETAFRLPSQRVPTQHVEPLCGEPYQLSILVKDLRAALRHAYEHQEQVRQMGQSASKAVRLQFTWQITAEQMSERISQVASQPGWRERRAIPMQTAHTIRPPEPAKPRVAALVTQPGPEQMLGECFARVRPFVDELVVDWAESTDRNWLISREYGARSLEPADAIAGANRLQADWVLCLAGDQLLPEAEMLALSERLASASPDTQVLTIPLAQVTNQSQKTEGQEISIYRNQRQWSWTREARADRLGHTVTQSSLQNGHANHPPATQPTTNGAAPKVPPMLEPWLVPYVRQTGEIFVDVGANIGTWTRWLAPGFKSVHAIEPNPAALLGLKQQLPANVTVYEFGAWDREETITFSQFSQSVHLTAYFHEEGINTGSKQGELRLPCRPIDTISFPGRVDFLKCDTEGAEVECLRGAQATIARDRPWLLIECHSSDNFSALSQLLSEWRYLFTVVRDPHYEPFSKNWYDHCWFACQPRET